MATTKQFPVTKDARIARRESDNWDAGSGTSTALPFGLYSGYRYRVLLGFSINMSGWTSISAATLNYRTSNQVNVAFGNDPTILWQRLTGSWSEGSSNGLSASNAVIFPGPSASATNQVQDDMPTGENTWGSVSILAMMRDVLAGQAFTGIRGLGSTNSSVESDAATNVGEIYSREQGSDAYIEITYETNRAPTCTVASPNVAAGVSATTTPTFNFTAADADNDQITSINYQITTDASWATATIANVTLPGPWAQPHTESIVTPALTRGTTYYVRARATDDNAATGAWSATFQFKVASLPTLTVTEPSGAGRLGKITYDAGSGWVSPRLNVAWTFTCPDGGTQLSYRVEVYNDSAGAPGTVLDDSTVLADAAARDRVVPATLAEGFYYHVRVTATCSHGLTITVGFYRIRVRWGVVTHAFNMGPGLTSLAQNVLDVLDETSGGSGHVIVEYATLVAAPPTVPTAWAGTIGGAGLNQYFWYRAWLLTWGASPAVSPALNELKITYSNVQIVPDNWVRSDAPNEAGDVAAYVYGTKSFRMLGKGAAHNVSQQIPVNTDTWYTLSGRIQSLGNTGAYVAIASAPGGPDLASSPAKTATTDFEDPASRVFTVPWFSGSNTSVYIRLVVTGAGGTTAWFDALKMEASTVVTPWSPGYIANAVVLDSGGLQIDGVAGGIFRLRGSGGGSRDELTLSAHGITFGGDTEVASPSTGVLTVGGVPLARATAPIRRVYTAVGANTWTRPAGLAYIEVECQAGGGGGGGVGTYVTSQQACAAGGGGGGWVKRLVTAAVLDAAGIVPVTGTVPVTVGAGGTAGSTAGGAGGTGGVSSFGLGATPQTATGGVGGEGGTYSAGQARNDGGVGGSTTGDRDYYARGTTGNNSATIGGVSVGGGNGGSSPLGGGGKAASGSGPGTIGNAYGGGGGGAMGLSSGNGNQPGGAGAQGVVIVTEYYA